jgi:catalase-peroxidase
VLGNNVGGSTKGVFTTGRRADDFFVNLLDMGTEWKPLARPGRVRRPRPQERRRQVDRQPRRPGVRLQRRAARPGRGLCQRDAKEKFVKDFVAAWAKVMDLDRLT